ncbi:unnamed protein product [Laminaria digitata]
MLFEGNRLCQSVGALSEMFCSRTIVIIGVTSLTNNLESENVVCPTVVVCVTVKHRNTMVGTDATAGDTCAAEFSLNTNRDVMTLLAEILSNQHAFFAGVSKDWRNAWRHLPKTTQAITADTSVSQLQWSFDGGL